MEKQHYNGYNSFLTKKGLRSFSEGTTKERIFIFLRN